MMLAPLLLAAGPPPPLSQDTIALRAGLVITRSAVVRPGTYLLRAPPGDSAVVRVKGSGLVLDFAGAILAGSPLAAPPDTREGIGILIEGGRDVTIRGATVRGFKLGVLARGVADLTLENLDVSRNWAPRIWSGLGHESLVDWLSFHDNEREQWLRYGAGLYLAGVSGGLVRGSTAREEMNGLLLVGSTGVRVDSNEFSYLSGLGIGLYRSSGNTIIHNRLDYCVRGYVDGVYRRGQDSASLLLYEQSSGNVVAYNSMTHSGDGVFLWAGNSTMATAEGGSNDNLFFGNDVSWAVANGVEATFSRNRIIGNLSVGSEYGIWGGYSWETEIRANRFAGNGTGIAIEHGQDNRITGNSFAGDRTAVSLWANPGPPPPDWGYPRHRDTRSRDHLIAGNRFRGNRVAVRSHDAQGVALQGNRYEGVDTAFALRDTLAWRFAAGEVAAAGAAAAATRGERPPDLDLAAVELRWRPDPSDPAAPAVPAAGAARLPADAPRGRHTILVDQWGPWDGRYPRLWPSTADSARTSGPRSFRVIGPPGRWRIVGRHGIAALSADRGRTGDSLAITPAPGPVSDWRLDLEFTGAAVRSRDGRTVAVGRPFRWTERGFDAPPLAPGWRVRGFAWDETSDPRSHPEGFRRLLAGAPILERTEPRLDWMWARPLIPGLPAERIAVTAEAEVDLPPGEQDLVAISDDGIRIWVDDSLALDRWEPHESEVDRVPLAAGRRRLRVEYYQVGGWVELRVEVRRPGL